nr:uncharacterized protein LOC116277987 [Vicugna pacos]
MSQTRDPPSERLLAGRAQARQRGTLGLRRSPQPHPFPSSAQAKQEGAGRHLRPSPQHVEIPKDLGWGREVGPGAIKWLPLPPPGLARLWDRARHKRRVISVPATLPPPPSALRRATGRRGLAARSPRRPGRARGPEHPWTPPELSGALFVPPPTGAPSCADKEAEAAAEKLREKAGLTWGPNAPPDSRFALVRCLAPRAQAEGAGAAPSWAPLGEHGKLPLPLGPAPRSSLSPHRATQARSHRLLSPGTLSVQGIPTAPVAG